MMRNLKNYFLGILLILSFTNLNGQAIFTLPNTAANNGDNFCVEVTAENLTQVQSMMFSINWDPSIIDFTGYNNLAPEFSAASIFTTNAPSGIITFSFFTGNPSGVTLAPNGVLFELCFTVVGAQGGSTDIQFTNNPSIIEIVTVPSAGANIGLVVQGGNVNLPLPLEIAIPNETLATGTSFCVPFTVSNFNNIVSIQYTTTWDPTVMQFDSVTAFNLIELDAGDFGPMSVTDLLVMSWFHTPTTGVTLPDNTVIFEMCFTIVGNPGDMTTIEFIDTPLLVEVIEAASSLDIGLVNTGGSVTVLQSVFVTNSNITNTNCKDTLMGAIDIAVAGGVGPYTYLWSNSEITQDISGLTAGTYTVTITDSNTTPNVLVESFTVVGDFQEPIANAGTDTTLNCSDPLLMLDGSGSASGPHITYLWSTGGTGTILSETTISPTVNAAGLYTLVVTDTLNGCSASDDVIVGGTAIPPVVDAGMTAEINCTATQVTLSGDVNPSAGNYDYLWTSTVPGSIVSGSNGISATVDAEALYTLLVTDNISGCTATDTVSVISNIDIPTVDAGDVMTLNCEDVEVMLDGTGSASGMGIEYLWTTTSTGSIQNSMTPTPTVNTAGSYQLQVTNTTNNCTSTATVMVLENITPPTAMATSGGTIDCSNNTVTLDGTGSSVGINFIYEWTSVLGNIASGATTLMPVVDNAGTYVLTVTDTVNHCTATVSSIVTVNGSIPNADAGPPRVLNCAVDSVQLDGTNSSLGSGFTYSWSSTPGGNFLSATDFIAPHVNAPGEYTLVVTDTSSNCSSSSTVTVTIDTIAPFAEAPPRPPLTCVNLVDTLSRGNSSNGFGFTFNWSTTNGSIISASPLTGDIIINGEGDYILIITDDNNHCTATDTVTITMDTTSPMAIAGLDTVLTCSDTIISLDGTSSSTGNDFTYSWTTNFGNFISGENTLSPQIDATGEYELIVTDTTNGCTAFDIVEVTQDDNFPITDAGLNGTITCTNPQIVLDATASSSMGPNFTYQWTTAGMGNIFSGGTTLMPTVDGPGPYTLTITNTQNDCTSTDFVIVSANNTIPTADAGGNAALNCDTTMIILDGTGSSVGTGIEYLWTTSNGNIVMDSTTLTPTINSGGTYQLLVINTTNGCSSTDIITVTQDSNLPVSVVSTTSNIDCETPQIIIDGTGSTILANHTFEWITTNGSFVSDTNTLMPIIDEPGTYLLLITDNVTGCSSQSGALVFADTMMPTADAIATEMITCTNDTVTIDGSASSTGLNFIYNWTTTNGNIFSDPSENIIDVTSGGMYQLLVTDTLNGCTDSIAITVLENTDLPTADAGGTILELPCGSTSAFLDGTASSMGNEFEYLWTTMSGNLIGGITTLTPEIGGPGTYELLVTNISNNCTSIAQIEVTESQPVIATAIGVVQLSCASNSVALDGTGSSTGIDIEYLWTTLNGNIVSGDTTLMPEVDEPGNYLLTVSNTQSGCTATFQVEVTFANNLPIADAGIDMMLCEDSTTLSANLPATTTGIWLLNGSGIITNPADPNSTITNLQPGENILTWTLSAPGCPEYSIDTVIILLEDQSAMALDDIYSVLPTVGTFEFDVTVNDVFTNSTISNITNPSNGSLVDNGNGNFGYSPDFNFAGEDNFIYEICSITCPDLCVEATVSINVAEAPPVDVDSIRVDYNAITPNGDGLNEVFVFDFLTNNTEQFPDNELIIFNRWGDIVYQAKPYINDWGGTNQSGQELPQGTYYYILRLNLTDKLILQGDVTILK